MYLIGYALETHDKCYLVWKSIGEKWSGWHKAKGRDLPFIFPVKDLSFAQDLSKNGSLRNEFGKIKLVEIYAREISELT